ncbi:tetratricopeptide repeat protein [Albirhodobacter sp. R86504]|uniref:tetratricopeptide repeat protein n=1 Tax=Albirhodobacter sp. R86504 TaxID=3093848 RepID=UPI00366DF30D
MSDTDSFIDEVTEEVRRDRLFGLMKRYGWIGIAAVVGIVGTSAAFEWKKASDASQAQAFGDAVLQAVSTEDQVAALGAIEAEGVGRIAVRDLLTATEMVTAGDIAGAVATLQSVAAVEGIPASLRDLAAYKAATIASDAEMSVEDRKAVFDRLAVPGNGYRALAMEGQALILLDQGDEAGARSLFDQILSEPGVTSSLRQRASELLLTLGEQAPA